MNSSSCKNSERGWTCLHYYTVQHCFHFEIICWLRCCILTCFNASECFPSGPSYKWFLVSLYFPEFSTISAINMSIQFSIQKTIENHQTIHFLNGYPTFDIWETIPLMPYWPLFTKSWPFRKTYSRTSSRLGGWEHTPLQLAWRAQLPQLGLGLLSPLQATALLCQHH